MQRTTVILSIALLTGLAPPLRADSPVWREQSDFTRDSHGVAMLVVDNARGEVTLRVSPDDRIRVKALKVVRSHSLDEAKRIARETLVEIDDAPGRLMVRVRYPRLQVRLNLWENMSGNMVPNDEVRLAVEVPAALAAEINVASGDITSEGIRGSQRLHAASGDVTVSEAAGPLVVSTASGDVTAQDVARARIGTASGDVDLDGASGAIDIQTASGDVTTHRCADSLRVHTTSGEVRVDGAPRGIEAVSVSGNVTIGTGGGRVKAHCVSGEMEVRLGRGLSLADLDTQSGELVVTLDPGLACTVDAKTGSGDIEVEGSGLVRGRSRGSETVTFRGGGVPVGLRTVSGDIRVVVGGGK